MQPIEECVFLKETKSATKNMERNTRKVIDM